MKKHHTILIIDDEASQIAQIIDIFDRYKEQYLVFVANNGELGIKIATEKLPDMIILDWQMPTLEGPEVLKLLKKIPDTADIPVMFATGIMKSSENLYTALDVGATDFIRKPIDELELIARTRAILRLSDYHKQIIEQKNKELGLHAMYLLEDNEFDIKIMKELKEIAAGMEVNKENTLKELQNLTHDIYMHNQQKSWHSFEKYFNEIHPGFTQKLSTKFPNLNPAEIRLALFLRMNMSSKDIATLLHQSPDSIKTARKRLRKKLEMDSEQDISVFLSSM